MFIGRHMFTYESEVKVVDACDVMERTWQVHETDAGPDAAPLELSLALRLRLEVLES